MIIDITKGIAFWNIDKHHTLFLLFCFLILLLSHCFETLCNQQILPNFSTVFGRKGFFYKENFWSFLLFSKSNASLLVLKFMFDLYCLMLAFRFYLDCKNLIFKAKFHFLQS